MTTLGVGGFHRRETEDTERQCRMSMLMKWKSRSNAARISGFIEKGHIRDEDR